MPISKNKGFTLIELLISLTILAMILVIIFSALRTGARAWEKGEKNIETRRQSRIVLDLVKRQMASICFLNVINGGKNPFFLKGDAASLEFVSYISLVPENDFGMVFVRYLVKQTDEGKQNLFFYEKNIILLDDDFDSGEIDEDNFYKLTSDVDNIKFQYLDISKEDGLFQWQPAWDPETDTGFPAAVKIIFRENNKSGTVSIIARIKQENEIFSAK